MDIKLLACDLDGTLLCDDHTTVSQNNITALSNLAKRGVKIVIATGRTRYVFDEIAQRIGCADYFIMSNGTVIWDAKNDKQLFCELFEYALWCRVYNILREHHAVFELYSNGKSFIPDFMFDSFTSPHVSRDCVDELKSHLIRLEGELDALEGHTAEKFNVLYTPEEFIAPLKARLGTIEGIAIASSIPGNIEINKKGVNKGAALSWLCDYLGIMRSQTMAVGDNGNDKEMLEFAHYSYAMANAPDYVKASARFVTDSNNNDGVAKAIELSDYFISGSKPPPYFKI